MPPSHIAWAKRRGWAAGSPLAAGQGPMVPRPFGVDPALRGALMLLRSGGGFGRGVFSSHPAAGWEGKQGVVPLVACLGSMPWPPLLGLAVGLGLGSGSGLGLSGGLGQGLHLRIGARRWFGSRCLTSKPRGRKRYPD